MQSASRHCLYLLPSCTPCRFPRTGSILYACHQTIYFQHCPDLVKLWRGGAPESARAKKNRVETTTTTIAKWGDSKMVAVLVVPASGRGAYHHGPPIVPSRSLVESRSNSSRRNCIPRDENMMEPADNPDHNGSAHCLEAFEESELLNNNPAGSRNVVMCWKTDKILDVADWIAFVPHRMRRPHQTGLLSAH